MHLPYNVKIQGVTGQHGAHAVVGCRFSRPCRRFLGFSIGENAKVLLNETGEYLAGCNGCTQYAAGKNKHSTLL